MISRAEEFSLGVNENIFANVFLLDVFSPQGVRVMKEQQHVDKRRGCFKIQFGICGVYFKLASTPTDFFLHTLRCIELIRF